MPIQLDPSRNTGNVSILSQFRQWCDATASKIQKAVGGFFNFINETLSKMRFINRNSIPSSSGGTLVLDSRVQQNMVESSKEYVAFDTFLKKHASDEKADTVDLYIENFIKKLGNKNNEVAFLCHLLQKSESELPLELLSKVFVKRQFGKKYNPTDIDSFYRACEFSKKQASPKYVKLKDRLLTDFIAGDSDESENTFLK